MTRLRPLVAVLLSLLLLGAQQVAFAHMIGHIGPGAPGASATTMAGDGDEGHGEALTLSDVCVTCVGAAGLAATAPFGTLPAPAADRAFEAPVAAMSAAFAAAAPLRYLARAPPPVF